MDLEGAIIQGMEQAFEPGVQHSVKKLLRVLPRKLHPNLLKRLQRNPNSFDFNVIKIKATNLWSLFKLIESIFKLSPNALQQGSPYRMPRPWVPRYTLPNNLGSPEIWRISPLMLIIVNLNPWLGNIIWTEYSPNAIYSTHKKEGRIRAPGASFPNPKAFNCSTSLNVENVFPVSIEW